MAIANEKIDVQGAPASDGRLAPFLSPLGTWAYGVGTAIGWGSFIVTGNQYLLQAGPLGSVVGMALGTLVILVIARCYAYLMSRFPSVGGSYTYARKALGNDYGFVTAWFLVLTYMAVFWANATSLPLFSRFFLGDLFKVGLLYTVFGYEVYAGEVALTAAAILAVGVLCTLGKRLKEHLMIALAIAFTGCIVVCGLASLLLHQRMYTMNPLVLPDSGVLTQLMHITLMAPWAYIGFESVAHSSEEFAFSTKKIRPILRAVVITTAALYLLLILLSVSAYPARYTSWISYLYDLGNLQGIAALPPFFAAHHYLGDAGVVLLMVALLALVLTSLIGNIVALSRLVLALARDGIVPPGLSKLNRRGAPSNAIRLVCAISLVIPFLGRTAIGWIVDITTICAVLVYGLVSYSTYVVAKDANDRTEARMGVAGLLCMAVLAAVALVPGLLSGGGLARETYFLVTVWSVFGFLYFRLILRHDDNNAYGKSMVAWTFLLSLVLFSSTIWIQKSDMRTMDDAIQNITTYLDVRDPEQRAYIRQELDHANRINLHSSLIVTGVFVLALGMTISDYRFVRRRQEESNRQLGAARHAAYTDPLTGVKSKQAFAEWRDRLDDRIAHGSVGEFAVVVCDVNNLKNANDTLGHAAGDELIRAASRCICTHFAHSPVFRIGGDEFAAILEGSDYEAREQIMREFDELMQAHVGTDEPVVSAGISTFRESTDFSFGSVFERADGRMYERKKQLKGLGQ